MRCSLAALIVAAQIATLAHLTIYYLVKNTVATSALRQQFEALYCHAGRLYFGNST